MKLQSISNHVSNDRVDILTALNIFCRHRSVLDTIHQAREFERGLDGYLESTLHLVIRDARRTMAPLKLSLGHGCQVNSELCQMVNILGMVRL